MKSPSDPTGLIHYTAETYSDLETLPFHYIANVATMTRYTYPHLIPENTLQRCGLFFPVTILGRR